MYHGKSETADGKILQKKRKETSHKLKFKTFDYTYSTVNWHKGQIPLSVQTETQVIETQLGNLSS